MTSQPARVQTGPGSNGGVLSTSTVGSAVVSQVGWFACVLGAAWDQPWIGPAFVMGALVLEASTSKQAYRLFSWAAAAMALGLAVDSLLALLGLFRFASPLPVDWVSPPWMVALWLNFALALAGCLKWLAGRYLLGALLGLAGGPLAYAAGSRLGAMELSDPLWSLVAVGLAWLVAVPVLLWLIRGFVPLVSTEAGARGGRS